MSNKLLDADGQPLVLGAFYVHPKNEGGPYICEEDNIHKVGSWNYYGAESVSKLRRVPIYFVRKICLSFCEVYDVGGGSEIWRGSLNIVEANHVYACYESDKDKLLSEQLDLRSGSHARAVLEKSKADARDKLTVRCGQRWRLDGVEVELYDEATLENGIDLKIGRYAARNWDGLRVNVSADALKERGVFLSGPTEPETRAEAIRRVLDIEAANQPEGLSRDEWRARLINRVGDWGTCVRLNARLCREEHAEKWRKWAKP